MKDTDFNELAARAYACAKAKGFHDVKHTDGHYIMLVMCELAEAVEADRNGRRADRKTYEFLLAEYGEPLMAHLFEMNIKDSVEDELSDAVIRLLDYVGMTGLNIMRKLTDGEIIEDNFKKKERRIITEQIYDVVSGLCNDGLVEFVLFDIFDLAFQHDIDLMWYVKEKMKYNETREYMHGKKY